MADIAGLYKSNQSYNPKIDYNVSYKETGRTGSSVTYEFTVTYNRLNGSYGFDVQLNYNIGGATGNRQLKANNDWNSWSSVTWSVTCSTNAAGGTVSAAIYSWSNNDGTHSENGFNTGAQTAKKSTFNTAPTQPGAMTIAGSTTAKYIAENTTSIAMSWGASTDSNGNLSGYRVRVSINNGSYSELLRTNTSTLSATHNVKDYPEGTIFKYEVTAYDSYGEWSTPRVGPIITKNRLTAGTVSGVTPEIGFDTTYITVTIVRGSNTMGGTVNQACYSDSVTVNNITNFSSGTTQRIDIWKSGAYPTRPYIKFDDLAAFLSSTTYKGTIHIGVRTSNSYGTTKWSGGSVAADLRTAPQPATAQQIVENSSLSTAYRLNTGTNISYFVPDGTRNIRVSWTDGYGKLGEGVKYEIYVAYGTGVWNKLANVNQGVGYYSHVPPVQVAATDIKYLVKCVCDFGYSTESVTPGKKLHYHKPPTITIGTITRSSTTADVIVKVKTLSSIPNISTVGTWKRCAQGTTTPSQQTGSLNPTQENQTVSLTGLTDEGTYDCIITFKDNTGWSSNQNRTVTIGQNSPVFFVNKYGIGVNGYKATNSVALNVNGSAFINGNFGQFGGLIDVGKNFNDYLTEGEFRVSGSSSLTNAPYTGGIYGKLIVKVSDGGTHNNSDNCIWQEFRSTVDACKIYRRSKTNSSAWTSWYRDYNTSYKPSKTDVGLGNVANYGNSSTITSNSTTTYATTSMVAKVRAEKLSHTTTVWGGIELTRNDNVSGCAITFKNNAFVLGVCGFASEKEFVVRAGTATTNLLKIDGTGTMDVYNGARIAGSGGLTVTGNLSSANYKSGGATRITSLNGRLATGLYSWTSGATGAPTTYGTLVNIQWTDSGDIYQLALGSAGQLWTRVFLNGAWGNWALK